MPGLLVVPIAIAGNMGKPIQTIYEPEGKIRLALYRTERGCRLSEEWLLSEEGRQCWQQQGIHKLAMEFPNVQVAIHEAKQYIQWLGPVLQRNAVMPAEWYTPLDTAHNLALVGLSENCLETGDLTLTFRAFCGNSEATTDLTFTWSEYSHYEVTLEELSPIWTDWGTHCFSNCSNRTHVVENSELLKRLERTGLLLPGAVEYVFVTADEYISIVSNLAPCIHEL